MMKTTIRCLLILSLLCLWIPHGYSQQLKQISIEEKAYNQFAVELLVETSNHLDSQHNMMLSPFSIWSVLALLTEGALGNTRTQLATALHLDMGKKTLGQRYKQLDNNIKASRGSTVELDSANLLVTDKNRPVNSAYEEIIANTYHAHEFPVNFHNINKAANDINSWISNITRNRIEKIINEGDLQVPQLILANGLYFKGSWKYPFNQSDTRDEDFQDETGNVIARVPTMKNAFNFTSGFVPEVEAHLLVLPYEGDKLSMVLAMPQKTVPLLQMLERIKLVSFNELLKQLDQMQVDMSEEVQVSLPRFIIRSDFVLNSPLQSMGVTDAFSERANFHQISAQNIYVSKLIHKAQIEVNEIGTTATAVTGAEFVEKMLPSEFRANRPFAYFIIENEHKTILFAGRVTNPTA